MTDPLNSFVLQTDSPIGICVGANVSPFTDKHRALLRTLKLSGSKVSADKLHLTIIFSKQHVELASVEQALQLYKLPLNVKIVGAAAFDSPQAGDKVRTEELATLVLKLDCPELLELHAACKKLGCTHPYPELSPHVSLFYGVPKADCQAAVDILSELISKLEEPLYVELNKLYVEPLLPDWTVKNINKR